MKTIKAIFLLSLFVFVAGCASVKVALYDNKEHYPATDPQSVEVSQKKPEDRDFTELGEITVDGATSWEQVDRVFKIKAAEYGGNAVYVYKTIEQTSTDIYPHDCHSYDGYFYPHGYRGNYEHYYPFGHPYFPRYYYCYGYNDIQKTTFLTVVGIIVRYN